MSYSLSTDDTVPFFDDVVVCERAIHAGVDASCAQAVLSAQFWYLILIGAIDVHGADDRLRRARERGFFAHMVAPIGDAPSCDYGHEHAYVIATTGLDDVTVATVLALVRAHEHEIGVIDRAALESFVAWARSRSPTRTASC